MFSHCNLAVLILVLALHDQVHTGEIIGGHEVVPHSRPYMVRLQLHKSNGHTSYCDGFLVNEDFVMTAAHCKAESYNVLLGLHESHEQNGIQNLTVSETFPQKAYNAFNYTNDIMLLKLNIKAKINERVKPIALAGRDDGSVPNSCVVPGWGKTENGKPSVILLEVNVTLTNNEICTKQNKYCSEGQTGPSNGDSGGPLVCEDGKAYGVVSASRTQPGGSAIYSYTKIPDNRDWIDYIMEQHGKY